MYSTCILYIRVQHPRLCTVHTFCIFVYNILDYVKYIYSCYAAALDGPRSEAVLNLEPDGLDCDMVICRVIVLFFHFILF